MTQTSSPYQKQNTRQKEPKLNIIRNQIKHNKKPNQTNIGTFNYMKTFCQWFCSNLINYIVL